MIIISTIKQDYELGIKMYKVIFLMKQQNINQQWIDKLLYHLDFFINSNHPDIEFFKLYQSYINFLN